MLHSPPDVRLRDCGQELVKEQLPDGTPLLIEPVDTGECWSWWSPGIHPRLRSEFRWRKDAGVECAYDELPTEEGNFMRFKVVDEADFILGEESLSFAVVRNGLWMEYDAI